MTTNAVDILKKRLGDSAELGQQINQEKERFSAACLIHDARTKAGLTQKELAAKVGTKQSVISRMENADYEGHTLGMLLKVAEALDMRLNLSMVPKEIPIEKRVAMRRIGSPLRRKKAARQKTVACPI